MYFAVKRAYDDKNIIEETYFGTDGKPLMMTGGYYGIRQEWDDGVLISREYLDVNGNPADRIDGYSVASWDKSGDVWNIHFTNTFGQEIDASGINLARDIRFGVDGWS